MYALIQSDTITQVGALPRLWWDGTRWWDYRDPDADPTVQGWRSVVRTPRPADTATTTHEWSVQLIDGAPVEVWTERDKTPDEIEAEARFVAIEDRLAALEAHAWPAQPDPTDTTGVPTWAELGGIAPAGALVRDGGKVWRNVSGVPLVHPPSGFPGWTEADLAHLWALVIDAQPDPEQPEEPEQPSTIPWAVGQDVKAGDLRTHDGNTWRAKLDHVTHAGWAPSAATHAVWELVTA